MVELSLGNVIVKDPVRERVFQVQGPACTKTERCEHACSAGGE